MKIFSILTGLIFSLSSSLVFAAVTPPGPLVDAAWLKQNLQQVQVLAIRSSQKGFTGKPVYKTNKKSGKKKLVAVSGHIPGAAFINYKKIRGNQMIGGQKIKKMLPDKNKFEKIMQAAGVDKNATIIISTRGHNHSNLAMATRLYWQLKYFGHQNMAILDGGLAAWTKAGHPVESSAPKKSRGNWTAGKINSSVLATSDDVVKAMKANQQLIDNRNLSLYLGTGKKSYVYDYGHIPGAKVFPTELMTATTLPATFLETEKLRKLYQTMGIDPGKQSVSYCNSGALASINWFVLSELLGNSQATMYDGSMHQWTLEKRPVTSLTME